jgi:hypothetical protein
LRPQQIDVRADTPRSIHNRGYIKDGLDTDKRFERLNWERRTNRSSPSSPSGCNAAQRAFYQRLTGHNIGRCNDSGRKRHKTLRNGGVPQSPRNSNCSNYSFIYRYNAGCLFSCPRVGLPPPFPRESGSIASSQGARRRLFSDPPSETRAGGGGHRDAINLPRKPPTMEFRSLEQASQHCAYKRRRSVPESYSEFCAPRPCVPQ